MQLADDLAAFRRSGAAFPRAWNAAYQRVKWPQSTEARREWKVVLADLRPVFEAAYAREPMPELDAFARITFSEIFDGFSQSPASTGLVAA